MNPPTDTEAKLRQELEEAEGALRDLGYQKYGFGWGATIAMPLTPMTPAARMMASDPLPQSEVPTPPGCAEIAGERAPDTFAGADASVRPMGFHDISSDERVVRVYANGSYLVDNKMGHRIRVSFDAPAIPIPQGEVSLGYVAQQAWINSHGDLISMWEQTARAVAEVVRKEMGAKLNMASEIIKHGRVELERLTGRLKELEDVAGSLRGEITRFKNLKLELQKRITALEADLAALSWVPVSEKTHFPMDHPFLALRDGEPTFVRWGANSSGVTHVFDPSKLKLPTASTDERQAEREAFEKWALDGNANTWDLTRTEQQGYLNGHTDIAWTAWQAALASKEGHKQ